jgi:hypothetical protein
MYRVSYSNGNGRSTIEGPLPDPVAADLRATMLAAEGKQDVCIEEWDENGRVDYAWLYPSENWDTFIHSFLFAEAA